MYKAAKRARIALVASRFNREIVENLVKGATEVLDHYQVKERGLYWVPGAFEIPLVAQSLAESGAFDAIVCMGAIIRGETAHFEHVAEQVASGILQTSLQYKIPLIFSVLTTENVIQAKERSQLPVLLLPIENIEETKGAAVMKGRNEGAIGALAAIEMVGQLDEIKKMQNRRV